MKSYTLANGEKWRVIIRPAVAKNTARVDEISREILALWLSEGKSTGDLIGRDDFWAFVADLLALLQIQQSEGSPALSDIVEYLQSDPLQVEQLLISQNHKLDGFKILDNKARDLEAWDPSVVIELHRFEPKKKLIEAYNRWLLIRQQESQTDQSQPPISQSTPAEKET